MNSKNQNEINDEIKEDEYITSCHTLLFLKDQVEINEKLKQEGCHLYRDKLSRLKFLVPKFPKYTPQLPQDVHY